MNERFHSGKFYSNVVKEIQNLIKEDVILTDDQGMIVASTDSSRINNFHEGAKRTMELKKKMIMTEELTKQLQGVRKGICLPIIIDEQPIGVLGITGEPDIVEPFARLVQKVTELFIQDSIMQANQERQARELEFFVFDWLNAKEITSSLIDRSQFFQLDMKQYHQVIVLKTNSSTLQLSYKEVNLLKRSWEQEGKTLFIRWGQDKILMLVPTTYSKSMLKEKLQRFVKEIKRKLHNHVVIGVGQKEDYTRISLSFEQAARACEVATSDQPVVFEEDLQFSIIQQGVDEETQQKFIERSIAPLQSYPELLQTLDIWFQKNMSNQQAAKELHIHKNTLIYRLKRIEGLTNLNLQNVEDLTIIYIAYRFLC